MSEQANANVVRSQFDAYNAKDHTGWSQSRGAGYAGEQPGAPGPMNAEQMWMYQETFRRAFPDLHLEVTYVIAAGDDVVAHWTATGTHNGSLSIPNGGSAIPPTGQAAVVKGSTTFQMKDGKIVREWAFWDMASLLSQLGLMPAM